jgi:linoleoyl-CoA desaturase
MQAEDDALETRVASNCPLDLETLNALARDLDAAYRRVADRVGDEDLEYLIGIDRASRRLTLLGRLLLHFSLDPLTWTGGVIALWFGRQLNEIEVCHAVLHGTYDRFNHPTLHSTRVRLDAPISELGWVRTHGKHHPNANVMGRDPDARFGVLRQNEYVPYKWHHRFQMVPLLSNFLGLAGQLNWMVTGVADFYMRDPDSSYVLRDRSLNAIWEAHQLAIRKALPYYLENWIFYPALAGPLFLKVLIGNIIADTLRNIYTAATVYSGHVSPDHVVFPKGTRAQSKGEWCWMQIVATSNFEVPRFLSQLSGGLDLHIEHHLFPRLPPRRLAELAPEVRAICAKYGIPYKSAPWPRVLRRVFAQFREMSRKPSRAPKNESQSPLSNTAFASASL